MKNRGRLKEALGSGLAQIKHGLSADFYALRENFTARSFFALLFGALLLAACWFLYVAPLVYAFRAFPWHTILPQFFFGLIGFVCSNYLIFALSVHTAAGKAPKALGQSQSLLSDAIAERGPSRRKKIAAAVCLYAAVWAAGLLALGFVIRDQVRAKDFEEVPATVEMIFPHGEGYTLRYGYDLGGEHYTYTGNSEFSGVAAPQVGDIIYIKVDRANPGRIYVPNESPALVAYSRYAVCGAVRLFGCGGCVLIVGAQSGVANRARVRLRRRARIGVRRFHDREGPHAERGMKSCSVGRKKLRSLRSKLRPI